MSLLLGVSTDCCTSAHENGMSRRRRGARRPLVAMPSHQKIRWPGGEWKEGEEEEAWYGDDLIDGESLVLGESGNHVRGDRDLGYYEADGNGGLLRQRGSGGRSSFSLPVHSRGRSPEQLVSNNPQWGMGDVTAERALQISPAVLDFGTVQQGSMSRVRLRLHNCSTHIARARVEPFRAFHNLSDDESYFQTQPNVVRLSAGLSEYVTVSMLGRKLGPFRETLRILVSEHDFVYEIPVIGRILPEHGFEDALRKADLARKMKALEIDPLERTADAEQTSGRRLIPSAELTVGWDDGLEDSEEEKRHREAASVDNVSSIPTFPNVKWNTFSNRLRIDHRKKWKIEPDTSVGVDVIKQRYEQMVSRSNTKWSNLEDRFHVAKMIQKMSGLSRTGVLAAAAAAANKKKRGAASIAFADRAAESNAGQDQQSKVQDPAKGHSKTPAFDKAKRADDHQVLGSTAGMSRERREVADAAAKNKLLGELGQLSQQSL